MSIYILINGVKNDENYFESNFNKLHTRNNCNYNKKIFKRKNYQNKFRK